MAAANGTWPNRVLAFQILVTFVGSPLAAEPRRLEIVRKLSQLPVEGTVIAQPANRLGDLLRKDFSCPKDAECWVELDLPSDRAWEARVEAAGWGGDSWMPVERGFLDVWQAARIDGRASFQGLNTAPPELTARYHAESSLRERESVEGEAHCPIGETGEFRCVVPAGTLDLSFRSKGFVAVYLWRQVASNQSPLKIGSFEFKRGASLVGTVSSTIAGAPKPGSCRVRLQPLPSSPKLPATAPALPSTSVDGRGFFQLDVIPPGQWEVVAEQDGFVPAKQAVMVLENSEARLKSPLVLSKPVRLSLQLIPPQDPTGKPWRVSLLELLGSGKADVVANSPASAGGRWEREGLKAQAQYRVRVHTSAGDVWWGDSESRVLPGGQADQVITLDAERVHGTVKQSGQPLKGKVVFGREHGVPSVSLLSDEDGKVEGFLPRLGTWPVDIVADVPPVRRKLDIEIRRNPNGQGEFSIFLSGRLIDGEVVNEDGSPAERGVLYVTNRSTGEKSSQQLEAGGRFQVGGLEPGSYTLAAAAGRVASDDVTVNLPKDGDAEPVKLVLKPKGQIRLKLVGSAGGGLAGIPVRMFTGVPGRNSDQRHTGADGRVSFNTSPTVGTGCFFIAAPGYDVTVTSLSVSSEEQEIRLSRSGGVLDLDYPAPSESGYPILRHGGCSITPGMLAYFLRSDDKKKFQDVSPGEYSLCSFTSSGGQQVPGPCRSGALGPFGTLKLSMQPQPNRQEAASQ
ncbi:MAG: hypothetical protein DIJKHBIC_00845 [Thermoanaerobaculia bacterium]|nr:hypothetical protein [Thermoanaerobaculia bacterium]